MSELKMPTSELLRRLRVDGFAVPAKHAYEAALVIEELQKQVQELAAENRMLHRVNGEKQAELDRLMWEFLPDEMTDEQIEDWARHQKPEYTYESLIPHHFTREHLERHRESEGYHACLDKVHNLLVSYSTNDAGHERARRELLAHIEAMRTYENTGG